MLILLIGPKGSGKSHIGRLLESALGVHFFHVEPLWMAYHAECRTAGREPVIAEGIQRVHPAIAEALQTYRHVCVETTGASPEILDGLLDLGKRTDLLLVKVSAPLETCLERIRTRDQTHQIPLDADSIRKVYELGSAVELPFDLVFENTALSADQILQPFATTLPGGNR